MSTQKKLQSEHTAYLLFSMHGTLILLNLYSSTCDGKQQIEDRLYTGHKMTKQ